MNKIFRADWFRLLHSIVFYVSLAFILVMAVALPMSGMTSTLDGALGVTCGSAAGDDFMTETMGAGVINILISIILSAFICGDYAGGFAKNIFTVHASPKDYVGGKLLSMGLISALFQVFYVAASAIALWYYTGTVAMNGTLGGLLLFVLEKWLLSCALCSVVMLVLLTTRNRAWGIFAGFLVATGGLAMGISILAQWLGWSWLPTIFSITLSGASSLCTLNAGFAVFLRVLLASAGWLIVTWILNTRTLKARDI